MAKKSSLVHYFICHVCVWKKGEHKTHKNTQKWIKNVFFYDIVSLFAFNIFCLFWHEPKNQFLYFAKCLNDLEIMNAFVGL